MNLDGIRSLHASAAPSRDLAPGITLRELWKEPSGRSVYRVDLVAGATWPSLDVHEPGPELVYVLEGDFHDGATSYPAGTFLFHPAGSSHWPQSATGCSLLVIYPDG